MGGILVVDDDPANRRLIQMALELEGYAVTTAATGHEALAQAAVQQPVAILLDVELPDLDGWEVLDTLGALGTVAAVPSVLLLSASDGARIRRAAQQHGAAVLTKPFDLDVLLEKVERLATPSSA
ncbi:MAG TPA: response regulator [Dehalococcoidia bacterium]|nr:response regulator [Dehalococcoidia bacterium]